MKKFNLLVILIFLAGLFFPSFSQTSENYYITFAEEPWNNTSNSEAMTDAFGGNWARRYFTDTDLASLFTSSTKFIFVDGSAGVTEQFNLFLQDHKDAFTAWVSDGGRLFINCGADAEQNFGFDGTLTNEGISTLPESKAGHVLGPILAQPYDLTSQVDYTGAEFSHAKVSGAGLRPLITSADGTAVVLADKIHGDGLLLFGGLTTSNFHKPQPQAQQLRTNIFYYAAHFGYTVAPEANFTTSTSDPYIHHSTILSSDASSGYVAARTWQITPETFEYVNGTNQYSYRPVIKFRETGTYSVTLTVSNELGEDSETKESYITVKNRRNFYWVGGAGSIGDASHWATTSGGTEFYDEVPSIDDNVIFDENSFSEDGPDIFLNEMMVSMYDLTITGTTRMPKFSGGTFKIYGAFTIAAPIKLDNIAFELKSDDHVAIDFSGVEFTEDDDYEISVFGTGSFDFVSSFRANKLDIAQGTVSARGITIAVNYYNSVTTLSVSADFANSELQVANQFLVWHNTGSPFINDFKLVLGSDGSNSYLMGYPGKDDFTLSDVTLSGNLVQDGAITFKKLTITLGASVNFNGNTATVEQIDISGTVDGPITMTNGVLKKTSGTVVAEYVQLTNVVAEGGATFYADKNSEDNGGNTGWIFSTKETQDITFAAMPDKVYGVEAFPATATSSSGLPVAFTVASGPATVAGNIVTITGAGTIVMQAQQEGDDTFLPAQEVFQSFTVTKAPQNLDFTVGDLTFGQAPVTINTTPGESGNDVTYSVESGPATISGNVLTITGAGTIIIKAVQEGDDDYRTATLSKEMSVAKATQNLVFTSIPDKTFGNAAFELSATGGESGNPVVFSVTSGPATIVGSTVTLHGAGSVTINASQAGSTNYLDATAEQTFSVAKAVQAITFNTIPDKTFGDAAFDITAIGGESGNPVVFSVTSGPATIAGSTVTLTGAGPVTIEAFQSGNDNYIEAIAGQTFCVNPEQPAITVTGFDTEAPVLTSTAGEAYQWYNSGVQISGATGNTYTVTEVGIYTVAINASNCISIPSDAQVLIVTGIERTSDTFVKAYPNPVINELIVDLTAGNSHQEISIFLYDVFGRLMTTAKGKGVVSIPMQGYRPGQYAVVVHFDMQRITKHILKK